MSSARLRTCSDGVPIQSAISCWRKVGSLGTDGEAHISVSSSVRLAVMGQEMAGELSEMEECYDNNGKQVAV